MNITDKNFFDSGTSMGLLTCGLSEDALAGLCREAVRQKKSSVWVFPNMIENARRVLEQSGVSLGTVVSYPLGMDCPEVKIAETEDAADRGATDICVTFNAGAFKSGDIHTMIRELKEMGIELMVSIWPTVDYRSENFNEMKSKGLLIRVDSGYPISMDFQGNTLHYDATNPEAREYVWEKAKKNYYDKGVKVFWLDEAEPEYTVYDFENYRYHLGPDIQVGNIYPVMYAKTFFDGMKAEGQENIINLLRCAWAGSQKYGALVWSGDIKSSFPSMKNQVAAGLNMGIAGIPWWTTDIGGFFGANINDPEFHELLVRWFEYGCFCPVMRLHGYRWPLQPQYGTTGGATCVSGAPNEVWSYTDQVCEILSDYLRLRERMLPYITELMEEAHEKGTPVMRPLFYDFPEDKESWNVETEYMFGPKVLVKPITDADARETDVYLPGGASWTNAWTGETFEGGQKVHVAAPIEQIPLFTRDGYKLPMK